jgi:dCMP deaminase
MCQKESDKNEQKNVQWLEYYLGMSFVAGRKSKDSTKHGCVITTQDHRLLGIGFNGPPRGYPDEEMPTHRLTALENAPNKYDLAVHAEVNAVSNCTHSPSGGIAYVDGQPCAPCLIHLYQNGIRDIYALDRTSVMLNERTEKVFNYVIEQSKKSVCGPINFCLVKPELFWLDDMLEELKKMRKEDN